MGKFSYKKRKGTRKQSFKNRKRVKKGGDNHEIKDAAPTDATTTDNTDQNVAATTDTVDNTNQDAAALTTTDNTDQNAQAGQTEAGQTEAGQTEAGQTEAGQTEAGQTEAGQTEAGQTEAGQTEAGQTDTNANEAGNENAGPDWKEGQSEEEIKQAEDKVKEIEDMEPEEIDKLAKELAEMPGTPLWAKALAKSGAAGTAAKFLNAHPDLKKALIDKGIEGIKNADVSGATVNTGAPGAPNTGTGAPGANTGAAAPGGSYTADDAGYQKFVETVKTDPGILNKVVYVNDQMSQIFIKKNGNWQQLE